MPDDSKPRDAQLEEIVAYLDGELVPEDCARIERRLASDEVFRQQLQSVDRAWNALDELPLAAVDDGFSKTTMTLAVKAAFDEVRAKTMVLPVVERRRRLSTVLAAIAAAALGFLAVRLAWHNPNAELLADLPVVDNYDIYSQVSDADFLRSLRREMSDQFKSLAGEPSELKARLQRFQTVSAPAQRAPWLRELSPEEKNNLRAKFNRFRDLSSGDQQRLRDLNDEMARADNGQLRETMLIYQQWLRALPPARQFELRDMPTDERIETIKRWSAEMRDDSLFALSEEELRTLFVALRAPLAGIRREITRDADRAPNRGNRDRDRQGDRGPDGGRTRQANFFSQPLFLYRRELSERLNPKEGEAGAFYEATLQSLPERTREPFARLSPRERVDRFVAWMRQYAALLGEISQQDLERFFSEDLDKTTRAELLSLPPGDMEQALRWRYRRQPNARFPGQWLLGAPVGPQGWNGRRPQGPGPRREPHGPPGEFGPPEFGRDGQPPPPFGPPERGPGGDFGGPPQQFDRPPHEGDRRGPPRRGPRPERGFGGPGSDGPRPTGPPPDDERRRAPAEPPAPLN